MVVGEAVVDEVPNVKVMVHIAANLCAGLDDLPQLYLDKIVVRIDVLLDQALDF